MSSPAQPPPPGARPSLLRRALPAAALAALGTALVLRFEHTATTAEVDASGASGAGGAARASATTARTRPAGPRASGALPTAVPGATARAPSGSPPERPRRGGHDDDGPLPTVPTGPASAARCTGDEVAGPVVATQWGPVQVAAVVANGQLCDVRTIQVPEDRSRSELINDRAVPVLRERALAAQGAAIDNVSGATITTDAYKRSLQAVLDQTR